MLRSANELKGFHIGAVDGDIGSVADLLFDDENWGVRYVVADTGSWLLGRKVLLSPASLLEVDGKAERLQVELTRTQVENSPDISEDMPVSRQHETALSDYYGWPYYWGGAGMWGPGYAMYPPIAVPPATAPPPGSRPDVPRAAGEDREPEGDPHLRSVREVVGYTIQANDGEIGHVEDFLVDDHNWAVRYLVVDTRNWWPGKKVLVPPQWIDRVSWSESLVYVDLTREQIRSAPEWEPGSPVGREYEEQLYGHYGRPRYWEDQNLIARWGPRRSDAPGADAPGAGPRRVTVSARREP